MLLECENNFSSLKLFMWFFKVLSTLIAYSFNKHLTQNFFLKCLFFQVFLKDS